MKHTHTLTLLLAMACLPYAIHAQDDEKKDENLILNGSFEEMDGKLKRLGSIEMAKGWKSPTGVPADLFSETVAGSPVSAPRNQFGDQSALSGVNYAGVLWWSYQNKQPRSYLSAKLKTPMRKGQKYCVKYYVSLGDLSKYATNELGAYLSKIQVAKKETANLTYNPQIPVLRNKIYDDMFSWQGVCGVYEAQGEEQYLIIGNFAATEKTDTSKPKRPKGENRPQQMLAYYFIDDVSVTPVKSAAECTCEQIDKAESEYIFSRRGATTPGMKPAQRVDAMVIYFKRFQRNIDPAMESWIEEMARFMEEDPTIRVRLTGFIDETEKDRMRMRPDLETLAVERAEAVKEALVEAGIPASRISTAAKGAEELADDAGTEVAMSKNRRVEVELVR
ncbi:MAG: OmpA family protein [Flavobacteriales bacterium]|nr:OmpA family protein [Flavobacteriales bacterium]